MRVLLLPVVSVRREQKEHLDNTRHSALSAWLLWQTPSFAKRQENNPFLLSKRKYLSGVI